MRRTLSGLRSLNVGLQSVFEETQETRLYQGSCVTGGELWTSDASHHSCALSLLRAAQDLSPQLVASATTSLLHHHGLHPSGTISTKKLFVLRLPWSWCLATAIEKLLTDSGFSIQGGIALLEAALRASW